jgi:hypothetical protein
MTILRLSDALSAALMRPPSGRSGTSDLRVRAFGRTPEKSSGQTKSGPLGMADQFGDPLGGAADDGLEGCSCRPTQRAAARLLRAIVLWQVRRLEWRLANLAIDERSLDEV